MESLCDLFFELSNENRLRILIALEQEAMKLTHVANQLNFNIQESSRHLSRLGQARLTWKDADGFYHLTPYGELSLRQLQGQLFTANHRDYFNTHTLATLPREFVGRIGELSNSSYIDDVMVIFQNVEKMIREAEEYVWRLTDRYLMTAVPDLEEAVNRGVEYRLLEPEDIVFPPDHARVLDSEVIREGVRDRIFFNRVLERADVFLAMSEKEVAGVAFPALDGRFDYRGFTSKDERAHRWCSDLFQYYWKRSEKKPS